MSSQIYWFSVEGYQGLVAKAYDLGYITKPKYTGFDKPVRGISKFIRDTTMANTFEDNRPRWHREETLVNLNDPLRRLDPIQWHTLQPNPRTFRVNLSLSLTVILRLEANAKRLGFKPQRSYNRVAYVAMLLEAYGNGFVRTEPVQSLEGQPRIATDPSRAAQEDTID